MKKLSIFLLILLFTATISHAFPGVFYSGNGATFPNSVEIGSAAAGKTLTVYGTGTYSFETGVDVVIGRGTTDTDITYISLRSANGTKFYLYPDDSGALILSTTAP